MMTGEEGLDSLARCFFSFIAALARSYIDIFGVDGVMGGVGLKETGDDEGVERINGGGIEGIDEGIERINAGGVEGVGEGGDEGIGEGDGEI
jgi:hypothetical protein